MGGGGVGGSLNVMTSSLKFCIFAPHQVSRSTTLPAQAADKQALSPLAKAGSTSADSIVYSYSIV